MLKTKIHSVSCPIALYPEDQEYIERIGKGTNFSQKIRSIIREHRGQTEGIARYSPEGAFIDKVKDGLLAFEKTETETIWADVLPFAFNKKSGWQALSKVAAENAFRCQVYERKDTGYIAVWIAPFVRLTSACKECKKQLYKFIEAL